MGGDRTNTADRDELRRKALVVLSREAPSATYAGVAGRPPDHIPTTFNSLASNYLLRR